MFEINASVITAPAIAALVALGMALAFVRADPDSPTSRALAVALAFVGLSIVVNATLRLQWEAGYIPSWAGPTALIDMVKDPDLADFDADPITLYVQEDHEISGPVLEFYVDDLEEARDHLVKNGCKILRWKGKGQDCYIQDPFGVIFNLWEE